MVLVAVVLAAVAAGVFIGRVTKTGNERTAAASWQALPRAPIVGRLSPGAVWTGKKAIIWGGYARSENVGQASDGAMYDPASHTWQAISPSPPGVQGGAAVAWIGNKMVVWASNSPDGPVGTAVYDPAADSWRRLPAGPLGKREGYGSAWTGKELVVVGGSLGDTLARPLAAALDPRTGSWRLLPALNRITGLMPGPGVVWNGREIFVMGSVCTHYLSSCSPRLFGYNPATDRLRTIDLAKVPIVKEQQLTLIGWSGTELVFTTAGVPTNVNSGKVVVIRYDPNMDHWRKGTFSPFAVPEGSQAAWLGDRYVVADGSSGLQIYSLDTGTWQTMAPGPSPLNLRFGSAIIWTGRDLIAWSGALSHAPFNPTPNDGSSLRLKS